MVLVRRTIFPGIALFGWLFVMNLDTSRNLSGTILEIVVWGSFWRGDTKWGHGEICISDV